MSMGNNYSGFSLVGNENCSYLVERRDHTSEAKSIEKWTAVYTIRGRTCTLCLAKIHGVGQCDEKLSISVQDDVSVSTSCHYNLEIQRSTGLKFTEEIGEHCSVHSSRVEIPGTHITIASNFYGEGSERMGLIAVKSKKNEWEENPYSLTFRHYFAVGTENSVDIGLFVQVKIAGSRSKTTSLDFKIDGPMKRPVAALIRMFGDLRRATVDHWNPTCPHCEYDKKKRKRSSMMCWSSDHGEGNDECVPVQSRSPKRSKEAVLANEGFINGNGHRAV